MRSYKIKQPIQSRVITSTSIPKSNQLKQFVDNRQQPIQREEDLSKEDAKGLAELRKICEKYLWTDSSAKNSEVQVGIYDGSEGRTLLIGYNMGGSDSVNSQPVLTSEKTIEGLKKICKQNEYFKSLGEIKIEIIPKEVQADKKTEDIDSILHAEQAIIAYALNDALNSKNPARKTLKIRGKKYTCASCYGFIKIFDHTTHLSRYLKISTPTRHLFERTNNEPVDLNVFKGGNWDNPLRSIQSGSLSTEVKEDIDLLTKLRNQDFKNVHGALSIKGGDLNDHGIKKITENDAKKVLKLTPQELQNNLEEERTVVSEIETREARIEQLKQELPELQQRRKELLQLPKELDDQEYRMLHEQDELNKQLQLAREEQERLANLPKEEQEKTPQEDQDKLQQMKLELEERERQILQIKEEQEVKLQKIQEEKEALPQRQNELETQIQQSEKELEQHPKKIAWLNIELPKIAEINSYINKEGDSKKFIELREELDKREENVTNKTFWEASCEKWSKLLKNNMETTIETSIQNINIQDTQTEALNILYTEQKGKQEKANNEIENKLKVMQTELEKEINTKINAEIEKELGPKQSPPAGTGKKKAKEEKTERNRKKAAVKDKLEPGLKKDMELELANKRKELNKQEQVGKIKLEDNNIYIDPTELDSLIERSIQNTTAWKQISTLDENIDTEYVKNKTLKEFADKEKKSYYDKISPDANELIDKHTLSIQADVLKEKRANIEVLKQQIKDLTPVIREDILKRGKKVEPARDLQAMESKIKADKPRVFTPKNIITGVVVIVFLYIAYLIIKSKWSTNSSSNNGIGTNGTDFNGTDTNNTNINADNL